MSFSSRLTAPFIIILVGATSMMIGLMPIVIPSVFFVLTACIYFVAGLLWGLFLKRAYSAVAMITQPLGLVGLTIVDIYKDPTSHNLWPFEFVMYFFLWLSGFFGWHLSKRLREEDQRLKQKSRSNDVR